jgi:hypothetical protein
MHNTSLHAVKDLVTPIRLDVIVDGEFFDVSVNSVKASG